jgi:hypothetical protein
MALRSDWLKDSVVDDYKGLLTLNNGSVIRSVPASVRQIRGWPVDLLIIDEAAFVDNEIWEAAEPAILARPGSRVIMTSSPWGTMEHWFRKLWNEGNDDPSLQIESFSWSTYDSPLADKALLERWRETRPSEWFRREVLGEFTDESGSYFSEAELMQAVADYEMTKPEDLEWYLDGRYAAAGGIDWGYAHDANAVTLVSPLEDYGLNRTSLGDRLVFFIPWLEYHYRMPYMEFVDRMVEVAKFYHVPVVASETNGVGAGPTQWLENRMRDGRTGSTVAPVTTDVRRKQTGFGMIKGLLQARRLVLPRHPELLKQLRSLEFEQLPGGSLRIAVPERSGHDDVAMSFMQAVSALTIDRAVRPPAEFGVTIPVPDDLETVSTGNGLVVPRVPRPVSFMRQAFAYPRGSESGEGW